MKLKCKLFLPTILTLLLANCTNAQKARIISTNGYDNCIELSNKTTRVVLEPNMGGRVLYYELKGKNILYIDKQQDGQKGRKLEIPTEPCGGRFLFGPEKTLGERELYMFGEWTGEITGEYSAKLISKVDPKYGIRIVREFELDPNSSYVKMTQTMINESDKEQRYYYWSRVFAKGGGIAYVPLNPHSRFPKGYALYGPTNPKNVIFYKPDDEPNIKKREGILEVIDTPTLPKFGFDASEGWLAYISKDDLLFITKFDIEPKEMYGDLLANTSSIWYYKDIVCEIEPIGPVAVMQPGDSSSFSEHWYLYDYAYPKDKKADLGGLREMIEKSVIPGN